MEVFEVALVSFGTSVVATFCPLLDGPDFVVLIGGCSVEVFKIALVSFRTLFVGCCSPLIDGSAQFSSASGSVFSSVSDSLEESLWNKYIDSI